MRGDLLFTFSLYLTRLVVDKRISVKFHFLVASLCTMSLYGFMSNLYIRGGVMMNDIQQGV